MNLAKEFLSAFIETIEATDYSNHSENFYKTLLYINFLQRLSFLFPRDGWDFFIY